ncbi:ankyrin repeat-containing domain protein [Haematococcus lacustris]|nr:hypothetical protein QJQ45_021767 [Haematococcus lacustris]
MGGNQRFPVFQLSSAEDSQPPKTIFEAAERGNAAYITHMMERTIEFDINQQDSFQRTALHWAAEMGHVNVASVLKDYGINVGATECNGRTAIHLAARAGNAKMLATLLEDLDAPTVEVLVNQADNFGITPVFLTQQKGEEGREAFELLMSNGARWNDMSITGSKQMTAASPTAV